MKLKVLNRMTKVRGSPGIGFLEKVHETPTCEDVIDFPTRG
jgi:hypothetical protein